MSPFVRGYLLSTARPHIRMHMLLELRRGEALTLARGDLERETNIVPVHVDRERGIVTYEHRGTA